MKFRVENKKKKLSMSDCVSYIMSKELGIKFLTGDLIPHQTTGVKFNDLFENIVSNKQYQKWINTHFTTKEARANSQVSFNLSSFLNMMGKNTPSKITLDRIIKDVKDLSQQ